MAGEGAGRARGGEDAGLASAPGYSTRRYRGAGLGPGRLVRSARTSGGGARVPGARWSSPEGGGGGEAPVGGAPRPRAPASPPPARAAVIAGGRRCARVRLIAGGGGAAGRCGTRRGRDAGAAARRSSQVGAARAAAAVAPLLASRSGLCALPSVGLRLSARGRSTALGSASGSPRGLRPRSLRLARGLRLPARRPLSLLRPLFVSPPDVSVSVARAAPPVAVAASGFVSPGLWALCPGRRRFPSLSARVPVCV